MICWPYSSVGETLKCLYKFTGFHSSEGQEKELGCGHELGSD
jgi:hypothetical protein